VWQSKELGDNANAYLGGMTISCDDNAKGWKLMTYKGYSIGWGKQAGSIIKNHYPKGLRKNI
jgi:NOL1/NOP2/fmu family ribosome biogenesis protein